MKKATMRVLSFATPLIVALSCLAPGPVLSEEPVVSIIPRAPNQARRGPSPNIKVDAPLVLIPVTVTNRLGHPVTDLPPTSFKLYENNVEQSLRSCLREEGPVSIGFIVDASRSMRRWIDHSIAVVEYFLKTRTAGDEWFLIRFSDYPTLISSSTENPETISRHLSSIQCDGFTALNDAIYLGVNEIKRARNTRKVLIVLTDGGDNSSRYSDSEVRNLVRESDVRVFSIGLFGRADLLEKLGTESGGKAVCAYKVAEVPQVVEQLGYVLRSEYVLAYSPTERANDGQYRHVRVELTPDGQRLRLSWRRGYYSSW